MTLPFENWTTNCPVFRCSVFRWLLYLHFFVRLSDHHLKTLMFNNGTFQYQTWPVFRWLLYWKPDKIRTCSVFRPPLFMESVDQTISILGNLIFSIGRKSVFSCFWNGSHDNSSFVWWLYPHKPFFCHSLQWYLFLFLFSADGWSQICGQNHSKQFARLNQTGDLTNSIRS